MRFTSGDSVRARNDVAKVNEVLGEFAISSVSELSDG